MLIEIICQMPRNVFLVLFLFSVMPLYNIVRYQVVTDQAIWVVSPRHCIFKFVTSAFPPVIFPRMDRGGCVSGAVKLINYTAGYLLKSQGKTAVRPLGVCPLVSKKACD